MKPNQYVPMIVEKPRYIPPTPEEEAIMQAGREQRLKEVEEFNAKLERDDETRKRRKAAMVARQKGQKLVKEQGLYLDQIDKLVAEGYSEKEARQALGPFRFSGAKPIPGTQAPFPKCI